jgi:hypothetical protein
MNRSIGWHVTSIAEADGEAFAVAQFTFNVPQAIVTQIPTVSNFAVMQMAARRRRG